MRVRHEHLEEHLLNIPKQVRGTVEHDVHRGVAIALAAAQV
jgi:hypothetical protein